MKGKGVLLDLLFLLAEKRLLYPHKLSQHLRLPEATISILMTHHNEKSSHQKVCSIKKEESFIKE